MSEQQQNSPEIDLLYFFKPLITGFKKMGMGIGYAFRKVIANFLFFVIIAVIITAAGFSLRYVLTPDYKTQGIFVSNILPAKYCKILLLNLNKYTGENNQPLLANELNISEAAAADIKSVRMTSMMRDTFLIDRRDSALSLFKVTLILEKMDNLSTIQKGIISYLENTEYAIKRKEAKRKTLEALKITLNKRMESLDSLKQIVNNSITPRGEGKGIILGEPIDPVSVYNAEMSYYREQLYIDQSLATIDNIEVVQPFYKLNRKNHPDFFWLLQLSFLGSIVIAALVVLLFGRKPK